MKYPNFSEERKLCKKGFKRVAGLDEAGRGPLAGPVIACALLVQQIPNSFNSKGITRSGATGLQFRIPKVLKSVNDSKKLNSKKREEIYEVLINHPKIEWGIGRVSEKIIDRINILEATKLAMKRAVKNLEKKLKKPINFLILDGRIKINSDISQKSIIKGDNKVFSCAAASIIAKVTRDRMMQRYDRKHPQYGFLKHKGYGTKFHIKTLKAHGPCKIHRKSFKPVKNC